MVLDESLSFVKGELDAYLKQRSGNSNQDKVVLSDIVKQNGEIALEQDQVGIALVNIEEERIGKSQHPRIGKRNGSHFRSNPDIKLNLYLLFFARFDKYDEALKAISRVVGFFQARNVFARSEYPSMSASLDKLIFELQTMDFEQMNHLWGALGAKYMPSVMYKMRMLTVDEEEITSDVLPIKEINLEGT